MDLKSAKSAIKFQAGAGFHKIDYKGKEVNFMREGDKMMKAGLGF